MQLALVDVQTHQVHPAEVPVGALQGAPEAAAGIQNRFAIHTLPASQTMRQSRFAAVANSERDPAARGGSGQYPQCTWRPKASTKRASPASSLRGRRPKEGREGAEPAGRITPGGHRS